MKYQNTARFVDSMDTELLDTGEVKTFERQMSTYSVQALKAALPVSRLFIETPSTKPVVEALARVFQLAREFETPTGAVLVGPTGVGKTSSFTFFRKTLPNSSLFTQSNACIYVRSWKGMRASHLISTLLKYCEYPFYSGSEKQMDARKRILFDLIDQKGTRLLFVDEAHNVIRKSIRRSDTKTGETEMTDLLREIMDTCNVGLVLAGPEELTALQDSDRALYDRLSTRLVLSPLDLDLNWAAVVGAFAKSVPIDLSFLGSNNQIALLHRATGGSLRQLKYLIREVVLLMVHRNIVACDAAVMKEAAVALFGAGTDGANVYA